MEKALLAFSFIFTYFFAKVFQITDVALCPEIIKYAFKKDFHT